MEVITALALTFYAISSLCSLLVVLRYLLVQYEPLVAITAVFGLANGLLPLLTYAFDGLSTVSGPRTGFPSYWCIVQAVLFNSSAVSIVICMLAHILRIYRIFRLLFQAPELPKYILSITASFLLLIIGTSTLSALENFDDIIHIEFYCDISTASNAAMYLNVFITVSILIGTYLSIRTWISWIPQRKVISKNQPQLPINFYLRMMIMSSYFIINGFIVAFSYLSDYLSLDPTLRYDHRLDIPGLMNGLTGIVMFVGLAPTREFWSGWSKLLGKKTSGVRGKRESNATGTKA